MNSVLYATLFSAGFGAGALFQNTTGGYNVAVGSNALYSNTTASNNTAVGYQAGYSNTTGTQNTCVGYVAGYNTTGSYNTYLGVGAGYQMTSGSYNTVIGNFNGNQNGLSILTASNYIVLSDGDGNPRCYWNGNGEMIQNYTTDVAAASAVFTSACATTANQYGLLITFTAAPNNGGQYMIKGSDSSATRFAIYSNGGLANYQANNSNLSDQREKKDIELAGNYLDKVCAIPVKTF